MLRVGGIAHVGARLIVSAHSVERNENRMQDGRQEWVENMHNIHDTFD